MAKTNEAAKDNFIKKIGRFFKNLGIRIARSFKDMVAELKKVTWPQRKELVFRGGSCVHVSNGHHHLRYRRRCRRTGTVDYSVIRLE